MNISIVIPVRDDLRLQACLNSIDESVEVVISLNDPTDHLEQLVATILTQKESGKAYQDLEIQVCRINHPSIAGGYNNGISNARHQEILLMDSDCTFGSGCIRKLHECLGQKLLAKGKVIFTHGSLSTRIVAKAREYHTSDRLNAYSPPLLFRKEIIESISGYYFHPSLCWLEDSEFDARVQKAGLDIVYDPTAVVHHPPLTIIRDLRSAFWYGVGKRIGVNLGIHDAPTGVIGSARKYIFEASKHKGGLAGLYLFVWKLALLLGYLIQGIAHIRKEVP